MAYVSGRQTITAQFIKYLLCYDMIEIKDDSKNSIGNNTLGSLIGKLKLKKDTNQSNQTNQIKLEISSNGKLHFNDW